MFFLAVRSLLLLGRLKTSQADGYVSELPSSAQTAKKTRPRPKQQKKEHAPAQTAKKEHAPAQTAKKRTRPPPKQQKKTPRARTAKKKNTPTRPNSKKKHARKGRGRLQPPAQTAKKKKRPRPNSKKTNTRKAQTTKKTRQQTNKHSYRLVEVVFQGNGTKFVTDLPQSEVAAQPLQRIQFCFNPAGRSLACRPQVRGRMASCSRRALVARPTNEIALPPLIRRSS